MTGGKPRFKAAVFTRFEVEHSFPTIGRRVMLLNARRVCREAHKTQMILLAIEVITEHKQAEKQLLHLSVMLRALRSINQLITRERDSQRLIQASCKLLVEARGYGLALILLIDEAGNFISAAEAGARASLEYERIGVVKYGLNRGQALGGLYLV